MSNPNSQAEPNASSPATATPPAQTSGKKPRKGPRRATAPAGSPATTTASAPLLLVVNADGIMVPAAPEVQDSPTSTNDVEPASEPTPPVSPVVETTDEAVEEVPAESEPDAEAPAEESPSAKDDATVEVVPAEPDTAIEADSDEKAPAGDHSTNTTDEAVEEAPAESEPDDEAVPTAPEISEEAPSEESPSTKDDVTADVDEEVPTELEPATEAESDQKAPVEDDATDGDADAAPMSRRERRMAEQLNGSGPNPADAIPAPDTAKSAKASESVVAPPTATETQTPEAQAPANAKRRGPWSFLKALFFMLIIAVVVVATGTVLSGKDDPSLKQSPTELDRQAAWEGTSSLADQATVLADSASSSTVRKALDDIATELHVQAEALGDGLVHDSATSSPSAAAATATVHTFVTALNTSANELLTNSLTAEQAMGRVFAAAGTSQLLQARSLGALAGRPTPATTFLPARIDFAAPVGPECKSVLEPRSGITIDGALRAAALGEQRAIYAYQVATTRLTEPTFSSSAELLARHEAKLKVLNEELKVRCLPEAESQAGFTLDEAFTTTPGPALAALESDLTRLYADLAALSTALVVESTEAPAPQGAGDGRSTANPTELREISVSWLLDSAATDALWGGSVDALPGIPAP